MIFVKISNNISTTYIEVSNTGSRMEACLGVEREVNKVVDKFVSLQSSNEKGLSEIQLLLRSAKNEIQYEGKKIDKIKI